MTSRARRIRVSRSDDEDQLDDEMLGRMRGDADDDEDGDDDAPRRLQGKLLRRARRKAQELGIPTESDHDAVEKLREAGIDLLSDDAEVLSDDQTAALPVTTTQGTGLAPISEADRAEEVARIQRQLVSRRRKRLAAMLVKLMILVALPTFFVGFYYYKRATPMFETRSEFVIQKSESAAGGTFGGLFSGTGFATSQDSMTVQAYLTSREAMMRLDEEEGFSAHFQGDGIDPIQRLADDASVEDRYGLYGRAVRVGFDPAEGIIKLTVIATDPQSSERFATALIGYAEERIDALSQRVREDQMRGALQSYRDSEEELLAAQERVLHLQEARGVLSAEGEISGRMALINQLELELERKKLELAALTDNARPNSARVNATRSEITRMEERIASMRDTLTAGSQQDKASLARVSGELRLAESELATRQLMLQSALQQLETARIEANRQVRYLSLGVAPISPDVATYPRKLENTFLAFVIFGSLYILASLTISILREQVSV